MAKNEVYKYSDWISLPVAEGTESGDPVVVGELVGVAQTDRAVDGNMAGGNDDGYASVALNGAFRVPVTGARDVGDPVHITAAGALTATAGGNRLFGHALEEKGSGEGEIVVRLAGHAHGALA